MPDEVSLYVGAMIRLFTKHGNYESRAKSRTRYLQDTLGADGIRKEFESCLLETRKEEEIWPITFGPAWEKTSDTELPEALCTHKRVLEQKQQNLYTVSYHPLGGRLDPQAPRRLFQVLQNIQDTELRISPDGTLYILNLTADELPSVLLATEDGAHTTFETSISCIGSPVCQHGLRNSCALLLSCIEQVRKEDFADGVLPKIHISGCPSSCGTHQAGILGFVGHSKKVDGQLQSAFRLFVNGSSHLNNTRLGQEESVLLESVIPEFLVQLGRQIASVGSTFDEWYPEHREDFSTLVSEYAQKTL